MYYNLKDEKPMNTRAQFIESEKLNSIVVDITFELGIIFIFL